MCSKSLEFKPMASAHQRSPVVTSGVPMCREPINRGNEPSKLFMKTSSKCLMAMGCPAWSMAKESVFDFLKMFCKMSFLQAIPSPFERRAETMNIAGDRKRLLRSCLFKPQSRKPSPDTSGQLNPFTGARPKGFAAASQKESSAEPICKPGLC